MRNRITVFIAIVVLLEQALCGQEAKMGELLDRYVGLDGPLPRNEGVVLELLESPTLLKSELLDRIEDQRPLRELYFYGVLANRSMDGEFKYRVWKAAAIASLDPNAEAWSSAESVIAFLRLARAEDVELLEELSHRDFPLAPRLPKSLKQRIANLRMKSDVVTGSPAYQDRSSRGQGARVFDSESVQSTDKSSLTDTASPSLPKSGLAVIVVSAVSILILLLRMYLRGRP